MDMNGIPLFSLLQNKLGYLNERQKVIAQNVANASTPGYTPHDLKPFSEQPGLKSGPSAKPVLAMSATVTDAAHMVGKSSSEDDTNKARVYANVASPDSETTLDGNQVVLEEQMLKMTQARNDYDAAVGFYQKALQMLHQAVQKPGG
jgi:flagellar basal-body rod protein FlgB